MSYSSGEFAVPVAWTSAVAPGAAVYNGKLWLVGGNSGGMSQATLTLVANGTSIGIENQPSDATLAKNWSTGPLALTNPNGGGVGCTSSPALAPLGDSLALCWNDASGSLLLSLYKVGDKGQLAWQKPMRLAAAGDTSGDGTPVANGAQVGLTALDQFTLLLVCPMTVGWWASGGQTLFIGTFNINDIPSDGSPWKARTDIWGGPTLNPPFNNPSFDFPAFGTSVGADWFTVTPTKSQNPDDPSTKPPTLQLWLTLAPGSEVSSTLLATIDAVPDPSGGVKQYNIAFPADFMQGWNAPSGTRAWRDPAGRICTLSPPASGSVPVSVYSTWDVPTPGAPTPLPATSLTPITATSIGTMTPALAFFMDTTKNIYTPNPDAKHIAYAVYRFACYGDNSSRQYCQVDRYGTAQVFPDYGALDLKDVAKPKPPYLPGMIVVQGIIDGPIPVPAVNFANYDFGPGEHLFAELEYGHVDETHTERSFSNSWTVGFKTEGEAEKGFGPAWDVSLKGGMGSIKANGTTTQMGVSQSQKSTAEGKLPHQSVDPRGTAFGRQVTFRWTAYKFLDADGVAIADGTDAAKPQQAPLFTTVSTQFVDGGGQNFVPYAVRPGDLSSYTVEAINKQMQKLGYPTPSYFADVIAPNAYTFANGEKYIEMTWTSGGGQTTATYSQTSNQFTESSWSIDGDFYAGVSGGGGVSIFGIKIEEFSFKFLEGVTFSVESSTSQEQSQEWSIGLEKGWGAFGDLQENNMISSYTFQIYFLPPPAASDIFKGRNWPAMGPNYWVKELQLCAPKVHGEHQIDPYSIDPNSGGWRIFFVVDSYQSFDGRTHYP